LVSRWRQLLAEHNDPSRTGDAPGALMDELCAIEEQMVETPLASRTGWMALAEITQYDLTRELPAASFGLRAVAALVAGI
jgi:hypothetical protein